MLQKIIFKQFSTIKHSPICIIGGGTGALSVIGQLRREKNVFDKDIRIFEPATNHYFQPLFTLIAGGLCRPEICKRLNKSVFPQGISIIKKKVCAVMPEENRIILEGNEQYSYDYLIISTGIAPDWNSIKGAKEALDDDQCPVATIYDYKYAQKMNKIQKSFNSGKFIFTDPVGTVKCGGAPQKILFICASNFQKRGISDKVDIELYRGMGAVFHVQKYAKIMEGIHKSYGSKYYLNEDLIEVRGKEKIAIFKNVINKQIRQVKFDALHLVPSHLPARFLRESGLTESNGYLSVDPFTMKHNKYPNIFGLGDCCSLPTSKTGGAAFNQTGPLIDSLMQNYDKQSLRKKIREYDGYTACPIVTSRNTVLLAEFKYDKVVDETFPAFIHNKPRMLFYFMKRYVFPFFYWHVAPRGFWFGMIKEKCKFNKMFTHLF